MTQAVLYPCDALQGIKNGTRSHGASVVKESRSEAESEIGQAIARFEREYMGRGPEDARVFIFEDTVFIRLRGVLTPAEKQLAQAEDAHAGRKLIKEVRQELLEKARVLLETIITDILNTGIRSLHTDISTTTGERIIVFTLEEKPDFRNDLPGSSPDTNTTL